MSYDELLAEQQALLNQEQQWQWGIMVLYVGVFLLVAFVLYMFYTSLRDLVEESRMFDISFEFAHGPEEPPAPPPPRRVASPAPDALKTFARDAK